MIFSYDKFNRLDKPQLYLAKPNKKYIGTIQGRELVSDLFFNGISEVKFKVNKYENGEVTLHYDEIEKLKLVEVSYIGWFQITDEHDVGDGSNIYKEVTALSLENELTTKLLTSFGSMGVESDDMGGLDRYCLYNIADTSHSILHIVLEKAPTWKIGFIDPDITSEYRGFNNDSVDAYSFLMGEVSTEFQCVFQFDTFEKSISAYKLENMGKNTDIYLSYRNLVKQIDIQSNASDIKTIMYIAGGDDRGTPLGVIEVNPSGTNMISNFSYYKSWMSDELRTKYEAYETEYNNRLTNFTSAIDTLQTLYEQLSNIQNRVPSVEHSTTWSQYGLVELQTEYDYYKNKMSLYLDGKNETLRLQYKSLCDTITAQIKIRQTEYNNKLTQINNQKVLCDSLTLNLEDYLGVELYKELSTYAHYTDFVDDTFVVTDNMTDEEVLQMKRDLLTMAHTELGKVCKPSYTMTVDSLNFTQIPEFKTYSNQLYLGNLLTVEFDEGVLVESRLLKMHIEWDNPDNFQLTFSSKNRLTEGWTEFVEIQQQANSASRSQVINGTGWNNAKNKTNTFDNYMKSALDTSLQKLKSGSNEQFIIDGTGTMWKRWNDAINDYSPRQMWGVGNGIFMTESNWQNLSLAIGEGEYNGSTLYGVWAKLLCGDMLLSKNLHILNASSSIVMNENGATFTNCDITINKGVNTLKLNATDGIKLTKSGVSQFYIDGSGNATFAGKVTGGSMNINNNFIVDSFGNLTANNVTLNSGTFKGTLSGNNITGATINGGTITGAVINSKLEDRETKIIDGFIETNYLLLQSEGVSGSTVLQSNRISVSGLYGTTIEGGNVSCASISCSSINGYTPINAGNVSGSHSHYTENLNPTYTSGDNIAFAGSGTNAASVSWCNGKFQPLSASDFRLKKNIQAFDLPDELFMAIKPKQFEFKTDSYGKGINFGVLSQQLENAFINYGFDPYDYNLIELDNVRKYTDEGLYINDKIHRVNYDNFISWLIHIVQKQQLQIKEIQNNL